MMKEPMEDTIRKRLPEKRLILKVCIVYFLSFFALFFLNAIYHNIAIGILIGIFCFVHQTIVPGIIVAVCFSLWIDKKRKPKSRDEE